MRLFQVQARDIPDAWFQLVDLCYKEGRDYKVGEGSYAGSQFRRELDYVTCHIKFPQTRPLLPEIPPGLGIPNPVPEGMDYIDRYLPYLMTDERKEGEQYTYGQRLFGRPGLVRLPNGTIQNTTTSQVEEVIEKFKRGFANNQACMTVAQPSDIHLTDPPCFPEGTLVWTGTKLKEIQDIEVGDKVLTDKGRWKRVTKVHKTYESGSLEVIKRRGSGDKLFCTQNHPILNITTEQCPFDTSLTCKESCKKQYSVYEKQGSKGCPKVYKDYSLKWTNAGEIRKGDFIPVPKIKQKLSCPFSKEEMYLFGLFLAEGWTTKEDGIIFTLGDHETELHDKVIQFMGQVYDLDPHFDRTSQGSTKIIFYSRSLAKRYLKMFSKGARNKEVPSSFLEYDSAYLEALIDGWVDGDGHEREKGIELYTSSPKLREFAKMAVIQLGFYPSITEPTPKDTKINGRVISSNGPGWQISWNPNQTRTHCWQDDNFTYLKTSARTQIAAAGYVYNLEVEDDATYIANGFTVHNCLRQIDCRIYPADEVPQLHFIIYFRSWDLYSGLPANLAAIAYLQEYMAMEIGVECGEFICSSKGLHLYSMCWKLAKTRLGDNE